MENRNDKGRTPLLTAAENNQTGAIKCLIEEGRANIEAELDNERGSRGSTPLLLAVRKGHLEAVKVLLKKGANASATAGDPDYNAIQLALFSSEDELLDIVRELMKYEVDLAVLYSRDGENLLHIATRGRNAR